MRSIAAVAPQMKYSRSSPSADGPRQGIDRNCRLIKGQVFLWPTAKDWPDLWDEDGTIAGA